ncbi:insoluble matrix shell protein 4-like isoform X2 [Apteryx mantelli]|uniref:Insoluble matrix shell protein 4-like isoform X2 n=1 Tax=Apteryx mantelli TaxID=2696672 RepID=A0A8B7JRD4_9AVES
MHSLSLKDRVPCCKEEAMERRICVAFLAICLLLLGGTKAASLNSHSFNGNIAGDGSFNDNGNGFESPAIYEPLGASGNHESFDWNRVGHNSFNDNGNGFESPAIYEPLGASGNHESFDWNRVGHNSFNDNGDS